MVLPYGGTRYSCVEFVDEYVSDREEKGDTVPFKDRAKANIFLANIIWESIGNTVIKAREAMDWLQKVARLCAATKTPVHWTTPLGFPVKQAYYSQKDMIVKTKMMGRIRIRSNTDKINKRKQANGISPNFVHSLDATHMFLTIDHCLQNGLKDFGMVHDSYATLPADMEILNKCARSAFIQMYTEMDPLEHFKDQITALIPEKLRKKIPPLPKKGKLDIHEIAKAKYFFS
jgi:DNA-directed RNA polymerase